MDANQALVLVVDDDRPSRQFCARLLEDRNYRTLEATNGRDAIELTQLHNPDLILMDVAMPIMNGLKATRVLKGNPETSRIPIILFASEVAHDDPIKCLDAGADECMTKPLNFDELMTRTDAMTGINRAMKRVHQINEKLSDMIEEQTDRLELLYELARELSKHDDLNDALEATIRAAAKATGSQRASIMLLNDQDQHLYIAKSLGLDPLVHQKTRVPIGKGVSGKVFAKNTMILAQTDQDMQTLSREYETDAFVCLPILSAALSAEQGPIGVLNVTEKRDGQPFSDEEVHCLCSIADNAAVAIQNHIRRQELGQARDATIFALAKLTESRDKVTGLHIERVQRYCRVLAEDLAQLGSYRDIITQDFINDLVRSSALHDIGKVAIPDEILLKPARLTPEEFDIIKTHTVIGSETLNEIISNIRTHPFLQMAVQIARSHHEKFNGAGYPDGLSSTDIPLPARILALADVYDALTTKRPYKEAIAHEVAVNMIQDERGTHFDPEIVQAFERQLKKFDQIRVTLADAPQSPNYQI